MIIGIYTKNKKGRERRRKEGGRRKEGRKEKKLVISFSHLVIHLRIILASTQLFFLNVVVKSGQSGS